MFAGLSEYEVDTIFCFADSLKTVLCAKVLQRVVLLNSNLLARRNMDELMEILLENDEIAAVHACTCNRKKLPHYPPD